MPFDAANNDAVAQPNDWDKAVSCAYLRLLGASQRIAAEQAGVGERTLRQWETCSWWRLAQSEARDRWLHGSDAAALRMIRKALNNDHDGPSMAKWYAERRMPEFRPPNVKVDATLAGEGGGPLQIEVKFVKPDSAS